MAKNNRSGISVKAGDVPVIIGMITRGDRHHDIAAWFGLNQGRIKDTQDGKYGPARTQPGTSLPPKGPPGIKGRYLRESMASVIRHLKAGDAASALAEVQAAVGAYDTDEV